MSVLDNPQIVDIVSKIGELYLNESFSDVVFIVDGKKLPAHQVILGQRCPVFKAMFSPNSEFKKQVVELPETPLEAFKLLLKFVYTGTVVLGTVNVCTVFETMTVANTYGMAPLKQVCIDYLKSIRTVDDVVDMINEAIQHSQESLIEHGMTYVSANFSEFIRHESFNKLPVKALQRVLEKPTLDLSADTILRVFVGWMTANPSESKHFPELLKRMDLRTMEIDEIVDTIRPLKLVDSNVLLDIMCEHAKKKKAIIPPSVVATSDSDDDVNPCEYHTYYRSLKEYTMKHTTGSGNITINFNFLTQFNYLEFALPDGDWSYWVEFSKDNVKWTRIIDYSKFICRGVQKLFFKKRVVRHLRICGTAPVGRIFEIKRIFWENRKGH
uniref:BTB domain-containing protein n=1 Tax=Panagrellus redivivus TaxID=6233 RepID=A0A7E4W141_PANRE